jgi:hypothetical protein
VARSACLIGFLVALSSVVAKAEAATPTATATVVPTPIPEPSPPFGRVVYRAARVASFESLGVTMIACRQRDPEPRQLAVQFFDPLGRPISMGNRRPVTLAPGKKVVFVTDGMHFERRPDVTNLALAHLSRGTARIVSDATVVRCIGKVRFDAGGRLPSWRDEVGLVREGVPLPTMPQYWRVSPYAPPRRAVAP